MSICPVITRIILMLVLLITTSISYADNYNCTDSRDWPADYPSGSITLMLAIESALKNHPDIVAAECNILAAEGRTLQAGLIPNPELGLEIENFAGGGNRSGFESAETSLQISQLIELGGKRARRITAAGLDRDRTVWEREAKRLDIITSTRKEFVAVAAAQQHLALADELVKLAEEVVHNVKERIKAGKVSPIEESRAQVTATSTRIEVAHAKAELAAARKRLSAQWGESTPGFSEIIADIENIPPLPDFDLIMATLENNPDLMRWNTEIQFRQAQQKLAEADKIPDITIGAGIRHFAEDDDAALIATVSVPLPIFNRNQGEIASARYQALAATADQTATRLRLTTALHDLYQQLQAAYSEVNIIRDEVLPAAQYAFTAMTAGYRAGKFSYLDVLDAQRTLFDARIQYINALENYHAAAADAGRLLDADVATVGELASPVGGNTP